MRRTLQLIAVALLGAAPMLAGSAVALPPVPADAPATRAAATAQSTQEVGTEETVSVRLGTDTTTATIHRTGAWYVKVRIAGLHLQPGESLTVADPDGSEIHTYSADPRRAAPGDSPASPDGAGFWALSVTGDTAVVSLRGRDGAAPSPLSSATLDRITRGFTELEFAQRAAVQPFSICGRNDYKDVVCYRSNAPTEFSKTPPVARLLMNGRTLCSGWRLGPNNRLMTNNHCLANTNIARRTEVWFNYQCPTCGGSGSEPVTKVLGNQVLKTDAGLDFTLFDVRNFNAVTKFGYLELDARLPGIGEEMYLVEHPRGQTKKLALADDQSRSGNCEVRDVRVDGNIRDSDIAYMCDTEGGSSGSPVLSRRTHRVIALHHFGGCPNQGVRIDLIANKIGGLI
ncbi:hypothetical protein GCM10012275_17440 [Longimycelium tulufanense]|uniref:Serine protease n=1 Tax=Longimycelium tulufanense TaxID=907463 RepID=A0A8J3C751_9PSEU|nr:serine protease [Longimycelium tulufanense]GGM46900.1 hypothetical protein GCM10012275_17440 [Longimycelium tulufanense]